MSKFSAFGESVKKMTENLTLVLERVEKNVGKVENAYFHYVFKHFFFRVIKSWNCVLKRLQC